MESKITKIYKYLTEKKYISGILDVTGKFSDEPQFPYYITLIHPEINFYNRNGWEYSPTGNTWNDSRLALLKCLMEMLERTTQFYFNFNEIQFLNELEMSQEHVKLEPFYTNIPVKQHFLERLQDTKFGWAEATNVTKNTRGLIPAQLIYPNYSQYAYFEKDIAEPTLISPINTFQGSAGGFDHESTLLRAIYEVVEREARTLFIALKHKSKQIDLQSIQSQELNQLLKITDAYNFKVYVFNIMNDLNIPLFMTMLVDNSSVGPIINTGFKAGLKIEETIIGSIEDAFYQRYFQRLDILRNPHYFKKLSHISIFEQTFKKQIFIFKETFDMLGFQFQTSQNELQSVEKNFINPKLNKKTELKEVIRLIEKAGFDIWYKSFPTIKDIYIYKAVIPGLQPSIREKPLDHYYQNRLLSTKNYYSSSSYYVQKN